MPLKNCPILFFVILLFAVSISAQENLKRQAAERAFAEGERAEKVWWTFGNVEKGIAEYEKALTIWRELSDKKQEAEILLKIAALQMLLDAGKTDKAKNFATQAAEIFRAQGNEGGEAVSIHFIAWHEGYTSFEKGKLLFEKALTLARKGKSHTALLKVSIQFSLFLSGNGEPEKALELLDRVLPISRESKDVKSEAEISFIYGLTFWRIGDYEKSIEHYEKANRLYKEYGDLHWAASAIENAALVYNLLEQPEKVVESYKEALPFRRDNKHTTAIADNLTSIAAALVKLNQPKAAFENLSEAMKIYEETQNRYGVAWAQRIYGEANFALGSYGKALEFFEKSRVLQSELKEQNGVAKAIYGLAKTELARSSLNTARKHIEEALTMIESRRAELNSQDLRVAFFSARRDYYELYIEILLRLHAENSASGNDLLALEVSERARARNLFEILSGTKAELLRAAEIQKLLDNDTALLEYTLGKNSSFLFTVTRDKIKVIVLPESDEIEIIVQEIRQTLSEAGRRNYARFVRASRKLYEMLFKPVETGLKEKKNLIIAPDASLNYLPFEVLLTDEPQRTGRADFQKLSYAIQQWTISYTPSATVLAKVLNRDSGNNNRMSANAGFKIQDSKFNLQSENVKGQTEFVGFADPVYSESERVVSNRVRRFIGESFNVTSAAAAVPRLADSNREVSRISEMFGASSQLFLRGNATEENVKRNASLQSAKNIHFATHGIINERLPQFSGLLLSLDADANEDGLLQTEEIYSLKLNANLVVLSACRTAVGKNLRGEGVIGLTRAFLRAGASSVAATLWQVEDTSTADLMILFYGYLKTSANKAAALREAKLTLLKNERFAHPHFWASFVLTGKQ